MIDIDVSVADPEWETECGDCDEAVEEAVTAVFRRCPVARKMLAANIEPEISVVLANDDLVQELNREYRDKDKPTNVLSFAQLDDEDLGWQAPAEPGPCALGDLILAFGTVRREAAEAEKPFRHHFLHLVVHGTLHLLGYDHMKDDEAEEMESLEIQILNDISLPNPYKS